jgi:hypothetical protein
LTNLALLLDWSGLPGNLTKCLLHLLDLKHAKSAVLNGLEFPDRQTAQRDIATRPMNSLAGIARTAFGDLLTEIYRIFHPRKT